jgi:hypothetical protein
MQSAGKLTRKQEALISALLTAPSLAAAAQTAGIGGVTAWRWLKQPSFQAAYREARREVVQHAIAQIQRASTEAVETLRNVMQDAEAPASSRVAAARVVLDMSLRAVEIEDLEQRVGALEAMTKKP